MFSKHYFKLTIYPYLCNTSAFDHVNSSRGGAVARTYPRSGYFSVPKYLQRVYWIWTS